MAKNHPQRGLESARLKSNLTLGFLLNATTFEDTYAEGTVPEDLQSSILEDCLV